MEAPSQESWSRGFAGEWPPELNLVFYCRSLSPESTMFQDLHLTLGRPHNPVSRSWGIPSWNPEGGHHWGDLGLRTKHPTWG